MNTRAGSKRLIREINEALILGVVRDVGPVSRATIAAQTGLSAATVTGMANRLIDSGFLTETDVVHDTGGRPARLLDLEPGRLVAAGVRVSPEEVFAVTANLRGEVLATHRESLPDHRPETVESAIGRAVERPSATLSARLLGIGVAVSGVVDQQHGTIRHSGSLGWKDVPLGPRVAEVIDVPVVIDSHVGSLAQGLVARTEDLTDRDLLLVSLGASLGSAVVIDGRVHRGVAGSAGGFAHTRVGASGPPRQCHCGAINCLEAWASGWGIDQQIARIEAMESPHEDAVDVVAGAGRHLGTAIANAGKLVGPGRVVLAVAPELEQPDLAEQARETFVDEYEHDQMAAPRFEISTADPVTVAAGAAQAMLAQVFTADLRAPSPRPGPLLRGPHDSAARS